MTQPDLLSSFTFTNGVVAKNRVVLAAMTNLQSHADGSLATAEFDWLTRRAAGGFGVVTTCAAHVAEDGRAWAGQLGVFDDRLLPGLTRLATGIRQRGPGALGLVQLFHGGARAASELIGGQPWSASEIPDDPAKPRAAAEWEIERVIDRFRDAAVRAHRAGFDGVELHGAHGYLLGQFLSSLNVRTDRWGGPSFENRARLLRETMRAVRAAVPASFVVGVRISPEDWGNAKGLDLDESLTLARWLADDGIDFLHLSLWTASNNTKKRPGEHPLTLFRAAVPERVPLLVAGKVWRPGDATPLLALGAQAVALARAAIVAPDWALHAADPAYAPPDLPVTASYLKSVDVSDTFVSYLRQRKGFVAD